MTSTAIRIADESHPLHRAASFQPASYNADANTVDVVWTTGAAVTRFDWLDGDYYSETLSTDPAAVRLGRLNAGAPVLATHDDQNIGALLGSVVPGTARMQAGKGIATIRLAETPDVADAVAKVKAGHLRNVSVGYQVHSYQRTIDPNGGPDTMEAVDWEPTEISLVPVPADPGCQIRSRSSTPMPDIIEVEDEPVVRRGQAVNAATIRQMCDQGDYSRAFERELLEEHADRPFTRKALQNRLNDEYARMHNPANIDNTLRGGDGPVGRGDASRPAMSQAVEDALYARMSGKAPSADGRAFMGASMIDLARGLMEARGVPARWESPTQIVKRFADHTTGDFPNLLVAATRRYLIDLYQDGGSPLKQIAKDREVRDFRQINALALLPFGMLSPVNEGGEFKRVTIAEGLNGYKLVTFGNIFSITRQALINDDLSYFATLPQLWARAANETEATQLAGLISGNGPILGDGKPLYDPAHGNLSPTGDVITPFALAAARLAMRSQKNPDGVSPANVVPKYLVVGPAKETQAEQALATLTAIGNPAEVNVFSGKLTLIVDPRIAGNSWRLFADPSAWPTIEYAHLAGADQVIMDERPGWDIAGMEFRAMIDFGCGPVDYRGTYKNPGDPA